MCLANLIFESIKYPKHFIFQEIYCFVIRSLHDGFTIKQKTFYVSRNLLFCKQEVTSPIKLKLFNTLFNFLFEGDEKIAWNMNFVSIKAKKNKNDKMILALIKTKFILQAIFSLPSNRKLNKVLNNFSLISDVWFFSVRLEEHIKKEMNMTLANLNLFAIHLFWKALKLQTRNWWILPFHIDGLKYGFLKLLIWFLKIFESTHHSALRFEF